MKSMTYGEARQIARDLAKDTLENYWSGSYPVDPVAIARSAGIEVYSSQPWDGYMGHACRRRQ